MKAGQLLNEQPTWDPVSEDSVLLQLDDYRLEVKLASGSRVILNLKDRLDTLRFATIADPDLLQRVTTDGSYIRWDNKVEISASEVFELAKKAKLEQPHEQERGNYQTGRKNG